MAIRQGGFERKSKASQEIPSSSLADIAFLLLIFFMVTTVFRTDSERPIDWVQASAAEKVDAKRQDLVNIWIEESGAVYMNDVQLPMSQVGPQVAPIYQDIGNDLTISVRSDRDTPYRYIDELQEQLVSAGVRKVIFATLLERRTQRERR